MEIITIHHQGIVGSIHEREAGGQTSWDQVTGRWYTHTHTHKYTRIQTDDVIVIYTRTESENGSGDEDDKRRRNTEASARFRAKKKQRDAELQQSSVQLRERVTDLEKEASSLKAENQWLRDLIAEKTEPRPS